MPSILKALGPSGAAVAAGQDAQAIVSFNDDDGFFAKHTTTTSSEIVAWHRKQRGSAFAVQLATGEYLHVRGRGSASITATNVIA